MIKVDQKLLNFLQMVNELKNKKSELLWKSDKLIHKKDEDNFEIIEQLKEEISQLEFGVIPRYIKSKIEDFKIFFSDEFIAQYVKDIHKDYVRPHYGLQGIGEDNEYDSYQYWKECTAYHKSERDEYFRVTVGFFKDLEAIYEWKNLLNSL